MAQNDVATRTDQTPVWSDGTLAAIESFTDAVEIARETYGNLLHAADVLGNGFTLVDNKENLIGVPFIVLTWRKAHGDHGDYVAAYVVTEDGRKCVITDGSTGIAAQLLTLQERTGVNGGILVRKGLRKSTYPHPTEPDKTATTFYLDTSK